jgi:two-component system sensor histidine kinase KdpD
MSAPRPDPDELLRRVTAEEQKKGRGRLTIFFGAAPGVGKTFAMLEQASWLRDVESRDVVAGIVETHGRFETTTLLAGFECLPRKAIAYKGTTLEELDLDAALTRKPSLLLVDELAHTNAEGSRHDKRWQDVEELLHAGIEVYTTLNVQHVESMNDVVAQITGVVVRETVPDSVLDLADEIKLVDLPPDDLLERLREGKVYLPAQAERALQNFFRKGNLIALRELALRKTAERVDADMQEWRRAHGIEKTWAASDTLLVCISPSPYSQDLLRAGRRMATGLHARWFAVNVETPATLRLTSGGRAGVTRNLRLAEQLGAETVTLTGTRPAEEVLLFARKHNITKIVVGKPRTRRLLDRFGPTFLDELILGSDHVDVYVTAGEGESGAPEAAVRETPRVRAGAGYLVALATTAAATAAGFGLFGRDHLADVVMLYLLGIVVISTRFGYGVSIASALASVLAFDFFFIPPYLTFSVADLRHVITFAVMLLVAVVLTRLTQSARDQAEVARRSERRTAHLYAMTRELSRTQGLESIVVVAAKQFEEVFDARVAVFISEGDKGVERAYSTEGFAVPEGARDGVVRWVAAQGREAGLGTGTLSGVTGLFVPLVTSGTTTDVLGVLGIYPKDATRLDDPEQRRLANTLATQMATAVERARLASEAEQARREIEAEQLRNTLLSSVSHDLRTPLAVMKGAASTLVDDATTLAPEARNELARAILEESDRLERLVRDLLDMTRLESGGVRLKKEWQSVEEVVGAALNRTETRLANRIVTATIPGDLLVPFDAVLVEQMLVNLLENAAKYTEDGTPIEIRATRTEEGAIVEVADRGPGIERSEVGRIFDKFHRGPLGRTKAGVGLGLAICRAVVVAHGGHIWVENREGGGAAFKFLLPLEGEPMSGSLPEISDPAPQRGVS